MLKIPRCLDNRLTDGGKIVSLTHLPHFTPQEHPQGLVRPEGLGKLKKNSTTTYTGGRTTYHKYWMHIGSVMLGRYNT
jgi:hypothetical protein